MRVTASLISITVLMANTYDNDVAASDVGVFKLNTLLVKTIGCIVYPVCPVSASVSVAVTMLNVITVDPAPLTARFDEQVTTAGWPAFREAPSVTVSAAPTVAAPVTVTGAPVLVRAQVVAASAVNRFDEGVMVMVWPLDAPAVGVKETTRFPPFAPASKESLVALVQVTEPAGAFIWGASVCQLPSGQQG